MWKLTAELDSCKQEIGYITTDYNNDYFYEGEGSKNSKSCGNNAVLAGEDSELHAVGFDCRSETPIRDAKTAQQEFGFAEDLD